MNENPPIRYCTSEAEAKAIAEEYDCDYLSTKYTPVRRDGGGGEVEYVDCVKIGKMEPVVRIYVKKVVTTNL